MLMRMDTILKKAAQGRYAVAAPNVLDADTTRAAMEVAYELKAPIILDVGDMRDLDVLGEIARHYAHKYPEVPVALNLDHGMSLNTLIGAIRAGFTSIMCDKSRGAFEENVAWTAKICEMAHAADVCVEAELGYVASGSRYTEERDRGLTKPEEASEFVARTHVDCLAIAIGNAHGNYVGEPHIDFERLQAIRDAVPVPLVMHGGSGTGDENLVRAARSGITKINLYTDLGNEGCRQLREYLNTEKNPVIGTAFKVAVKGYKEVLKHYITLLGSAGQW